MKRNSNAPPVPVPVPVPVREELECQFESLQRDIQQLQLERDLFKKANEMFYPRD